MLKVVKKEKVSGNNASLSPTTKAVHTFDLEVTHCVTNEGSHTHGGALL
jgi:hypothetical protein